MDKMKKIYSLLVVVSEEYFILLVFIYIGEEMIDMDPNMKLMDNDIPLKHMLFFKIMKPDN
jgi:hypothetical protein